MQKPCRRHIQRGKHDGHGRSRHAGAGALNGRRYEYGDGRGRVPTGVGFGFSSRLKCQCPSRKAEYSHTASRSEYGMRPQRRRIPTGTTFNSGQHKAQVDGAEKFAAHSRRGDMPVVAASAASGCARNHRPGQGGAPEPVGLPFGNISSLRPALPSAQLMIVCGSRFS